MLLRLLAEHDVLKTTINLKLFMAALRSRCGHYIFALWFLSIFFLFLT